jgi:hypothetical protein
MADKGYAFGHALLAAVADRPPNFADDFETTEKGWYLEHPSGQLEYEGGEIVLTSVPGDYCTTALSSWHPTYADFVLQIDIRFVSGGEGSDFQINVRRRDGAGYILHGMLGHSVSIFREIRGGECSQIPTTAVWQSDMRPAWETVRYQLVAQGPTLAVFADERLVFFAVDPEYAQYPASGEVQLSTCVGSATAAEVHYDNLKIWDISDLP